jgi:hypothetical protein
MRRDRSRPLSRVARWLPLVAALLAASCSGASSLHPVQGKVTYQGGPAKGAVVVFHPKASDDLKTMRPSGVVDENGTFTLSTIKPGDGAAAGDYVVTITWPEEAKPGKVTSTEPPPEPVDRLKGRYADRAKSTFTAQVKPGKNDLPPFVIE